ncbi:MAG: thioredoxin family protein [Aequorivita sp.]
MKKIFLIISAITIVACNSSKEKNKIEKNISKVTNVTTENPESKELNNTIPYGESVMLIGKSNRTGLEMDAFKDWFDPGYENYKPDPETFEKLKPLIKDVFIVVFMGTWCSDSQRDVPHLYKILDDASFDESKLTLINVSEDKTTPEGFENEYDVFNVPTIIFYKNEKELGRIVEYSIGTLEEDMLAILSGKDYKHAYAE